MKRVEQWKVSEENTLDALMLLFGVELFFHDVWTCSILGHCKWVTVPSMGSGRLCFILTRKSSQIFHAIKIKKSKEKMG